MSLDGKIEEEQSLPFSFTHNQVQGFFRYLMEESVRETMESAKAQDCDGVNIRVTINNDLFDLRPTNTATKSKVQESFQPKQCLEVLPRQTTLEFLPILGFFQVHKHNFFVTPPIGGKDYASYLRELRISGHFISDVQKISLVMDLTQHLLKLNSPHGYLGDYTIIIDDTNDIHKATLLGIPAVFWDAVRGIKGFDSSHITGRYSCLEKVPIQKRDRYFLAICTYEIFSSCYMEGKDIHADLVHQIQEKNQYNLTQHQIIFSEIVGMILDDSKSLLEVYQKLEEGFQEVEHDEENFQRANLDSMAVGFLMEELPDYQNIVMCPCGVELLYDIYSPKIIRCHQCQQEINTRLHPGKQKLCRYCQKRFCGVTCSCRSKE